MDVAETLGTDDRKGRFSKAHLPWERLVGRLQMAVKNQSRLGLSASLTVPGASHEAVSPGSSEKETVRVLHLQSPFRTQMCETFMRHQKRRV